MSLQNYLENLTKALPELPDAARDRLSAHYGITPTDVDTLMSMDEFDGHGIKYFEEVVKGPNSSESHLDGKKAVNWYVLYTMIFFVQRLTAYLTRRCLGSLMSFSARWHSGMSLGLRRVSRHIRCGNCYLWWRKEK